MCEIKTDEWPNGNHLEHGGRQIKLKDLYDKIKYPRDLRFEVMINKDYAFAANGFTLNRQYDDNKGAKKSKQFVPLDSCFQQFA